MDTDNASINLEGVPKKFVQIQSGDDVEIGTHYAKDGPTKTTGTIKSDMKSNTTDKVSTNDKKKSSGGSSDKGMFHGRVGKLRLKAYGMLLFSVVILVILIVVQLLTLKSFLYKTGPWNYDAGGFFSQHVAEDVDLLMVGMAGVAKTASLQDYVDPAKKDISGISEFFPMLIATSQSRFLEYLTVVNLDATIAVNINKNRTGETWDPSGIVSYTLKNYRPNAQFIFHSVISQDEYNAEAPSLYLPGRYSKSAFQDMSRTGIPGLIRWCATPIMSTNSSVTSPIGVLVAGYIMSGKTDILEDSFDASGTGMAGIWSVNTVTGSTTMVTQMLISADNRVYYDLGIDSSMVKSFVSADADFFLTSVDGLKYNIRSKKMNNCSADIAVIMIKGFPTAYVDELYSSTVVATLALFAGALVFDIISTTVGVALFVEPIHKLIIYVKLKQYELMDQILSKLSLVKLFIVRLIVFDLISLAFLIALLVHTSDVLKEAYNTQLVIKNDVQANAKSFSQKQVQMTFGIITRVETLQFKNFVMNQTNVQYSAVTSILNSSAIRRNIEINVLLDSSCKIIANAYKDRRGEYFSPEGFCEDLILKPRRVCILTAMTPTQFALNNAPRYLDSRVNSTFNFTSVVHPYSNTENQVIFRFCGVPIFGPSNTMRNKADGIMIYGDILNGKAYTPEWAMSPFDAARLEGYVGLFHFDKPTDTFRTIFSAMFMPGQGNNGVVYDILEVNFDSILRSVKDRYLSNPYQIMTTTMNIKGQDMHVGVYRVSSNFEYLDNVKTVNPTTKYSPDLFLVRGLSSAEWKKLAQGQNAVIAVSIIVQVVTSIAISIVLYRPASQLVGTLTRKGWKVKQEKSGAETRGFTVIGVTDATTFPGSPKSVEPVPKSELVTTQRDNSVGNPQ